MVPLAARAGATIVVVNLGATAMDDLVDVQVGGAIEDVLPRLVDGLVPVAPVA
jgi:NAD-dependent SIR2 family protein deacetylase